MLILVDALAGVQVMTEKVWDYATEYELPRAFAINWMDRELANFDHAMESITRVFGRNVVPVQLPIGAEKHFSGVIDLLTMKAHVYTPDGDGKPKIEGIPADLAAAGVRFSFGPLSKAAQVLRVSETYARVVTKVRELRKVLTRA